MIDWDIGDTPDVKLTTDIVCGDCITTMTTVNKNLFVCGSCGQRFQDN